ncbi:uncharacterized protein LOC121810583 [Salvia splendens]|uniref:uncharacterized protein LOC121810583 n=1 Tax=Salvia splendens TaxID=180675 RepID=UPI001C258984|nr:uncharacterized protein LOC121810583 [Salvia splendens]
MASISVALSTLAVIMNFMCIVLAFDTSPLQDFCVADSTGKDWWEEKHGKPPQPQTPWNGGGHAVAAVGGDGGNAVQGVAQTAGAVQPGGRTGNEAVQPVNTTGAANFVTGGSGSVIRDWSEELMREEAAPDSDNCLANTVSAEENSIETEEMEIEEVEVEGVDPDTGRYILPPRSNRGVPPKRYTPERIDRKKRKILKKGDVFVVPVGLVHNVQNLANGHTVAMVAFNSQNHGINNFPNGIFSAEPAIDSVYLSKCVFEISTSA